MNNADDPSSICSQQTERISVAGVAVDVVRKAITESRLGVFPPRGQVRIEVPLQMDDAEIVEQIRAQLGSIHRQRADYAAPDQASQPLRNGDPCWLFGREYRLQLESGEAEPGVCLLDDSVLVRASATDFHAVIDAWFCGELEACLPPLLQRWEPIIGHRAVRCEVRALHGCWGACSPGSRRIRLNLELAKKPPRCVELVLVHELVHLRERRHGPRFDALMDQLLPDWRLRHQQLIQPPAAHPDWRY